MRHNIMKRVIEPNHIHDRLTEEEIFKLKRWYMHYHKLYACYKSKYKRLKRVRLSLNMASVSLVVIGGIAGGVTVNPIVLGCVGGPGVLIQGYVTKSGLSNKVETCRFAYTSHKKILIQLRSYLRGLPYDDATFLSSLTVLDDIVTDLCPCVNGAGKKYDKSRRISNVL